MFLHLQLYFIACELTFHL